MPHVASLLLLLLSSLPLAWMGQLVLVLPDMAQLGQHSSAVAAGAAGGGHGAGCGLPHAALSAAMVACTAACGAQRVDLTAAQRHRRVHSGMETMLQYATSADMLSRRAERFTCWHRWQPPCCV